MKKNGILLLCVVMFIGLIVFVQTTLKNDVEWIAGKTQQIEAAFDQPEQAIQLYNELNNHWEQRETFWGMLLPHDNLQEVSKEIKSLGVALQNQKKEDADQSIVTVNLTMQHLLQRNTLQWDHIF
jgi:hypothetical protein